MDEGKQLLFKDIKFIIAHSHDADSIKSILLQAGAKHINYLSEHVTLVIADIRCPEAEEAVELYDKPVVTSLWVHLSIKAGKLMPMSAYSPLKNIFQDVVASFSPSSSLSANDVDILASSLTYHGARICKDVSSATHLITTRNFDAENSAKDSHKDYQSDNGAVKVVAPDWVIDSIKRNGLCDEQSYHPSLLLAPPPPTPTPPPPVVTPEAPPQPPTTQQQQPPQQDKQQPSTALAASQSPPKLSVIPKNAQLLQSPQNSAQPQRYPVNSSNPQNVPMPSQIPRPRAPSNMPRMPQPKFRPLIPPMNQTQPMQQNHQPRVMMTGPQPQPQLKRVTINYGQPPPYPQHHQHMAMPPQQQQQPQQQNRMLQPNMYHQNQIAGPYQANHMQQRGNIHPQPTGPSQPNRSPVMTRFQDPNHIGNPRPYQQVNPNFVNNQPHHRPQVYFTQGPNHMITNQPQQQYQQHQTYSVHPQNSGIIPNHPQQPQPNQMAQIRQPQYQPNTGVPQTQYMRPSQDHGGQHLYRQFRPMQMSPQTRPSVVPSEQGHPIHYQPQQPRMPIRLPTTPRELPVEYFGYDVKCEIPEDCPLSGCSFKLIDYLDIPKATTEKWRTVILEAGGVFEEDIRNASILICENRLSDTYKEAIKLGIRCVTIYWINDVLAQDKLTPPWKALHFPTPFSKEDRILGNQIISITNFNRRERSEIKEMANLTGARFTEYLSPENSLLICREVGGPKYNSARCWKVPIANCQIMNDFLLNEGKDFDILLTLPKYQVFNREDALRLPNHTPVKELMQPWTRPIQQVLKKNDCNNGTQLPNGTSTREGTAIQNQNEDSGNATGGSNLSDPGAVSIKKEAEKNDDKSCSNGTDAPAESRTTTSIDDQSIDFIERRSKEPVKLLFTHLDPVLVKQLQMKASKLGFEMATSPISCTHLIMDKISRTPKFVCAFSHARYILNYRWILESAKAGKPLAERSFILQDSEGEEKYSFNLIYSLVRRKKRNNLLFQNFVFFVTPSVLNQVKNLKEMIESAGAIMATKRPMHAQLQKLASEGRQFVVITCQEDQHLCAVFDAKKVEIVSAEFIISGILRQEINFEIHRLDATPIAIEQKSSQSSPPKKIKIDEAM